MEGPADKQPRWVFLTNHAHVLLCIARDPDSRTRDIAARVGITERAAQRIVAELIAGGYLTRTKIGRRNRYQINRDGHLRSAAFKDFELGPLLDALNTADGARASKPTTSKRADRGPSSGQH
jgi:predicted ArsR family transcriptional regulator